MNYLLNFQRPVLIDSQGQGITPNQISKLIGDSPLFNGILKIHGPLKSGFTQIDHNLSLVSSIDMSDVTTIYPRNITYFLPNLKCYHGISTIDLICNSDLCISTCDFTETRDFDILDLKSSYNKLTGEDKYNRISDWIIRLCIAGIHGLKSHSSLPDLKKDFQGTYYRVSDWFDLSVCSPDFDAFFENYKPSKLTITEKEDTQRIKKVSLSQGFSPWMLAAGFTYIPATISLSCAEYIFNNKSAFNFGRCASVVYTTDDRKTKESSSTSLEDLFFILHLPGVSVSARDYYLVQHNFINFVNKSNLFKYHRSKIRQKLWESYYNALLNMPVESTILF